MFRSSSRTRSPSPRRPVGWSGSTPESPASTRSRRGRRSPTRDTRAGTVRGWRRHVLAKKQKGSRDRAKARLKVAQIHGRIADRRRDYLHKLSTRLVRENQVIAIEGLSVRNMVKNRSLSRAISDASWSEFR
nr:transposase [Rhodococcus jostii]